MEPLISIAICTKDRPVLLARAVSSVLQTPGHFEFLVVDQSLSSDTRELLEALDEPRLRYLSCAPKGLATARNLALLEADADLVLFTDDDCEVQPNWVWQMRDKLLQHPTAALAFCRVKSDVAQAGEVVPGYEPIRFFLHKSPLTWWLFGRGMGAGMAVRRAAVLEIGGFDSLFGKGSRFASYEELDLAVRALRSGMNVLELPDPSVFHFGRVKELDNRRYLREIYQAKGAALSKLWRTSLVTFFGQLIRDSAEWLRLLPGLLLSRHNHSLKQLIVEYSEGFREGSTLPLRHSEMVFTTHDL